MAQSLCPYWGFLRPESSWLGPSPGSSMHSQQPSRARTGPVPQTSMPWPSPSPHLSSWRPGYAFLCLQTFEGAGLPAQQAMPTLFPPDFRGQSLGWEGAHDFQANCPAPSLTWRALPTCLWTTSPRLWAPCWVSILFPDCWLSK